MKFNTALGMGLGVAVLQLAACSGPGSKQLGLAILPAGPNTCNPGEQADGGIYSAKPVCTQYSLSGATPITAQAADNDPNKQTAAAFIRAAEDDSFQKCQNFVNGISGAQAADNVAWDVTSLILSGLGSVLTPVNTVRALSAASTAVQGTKQAINTDLFQQMSALVFVQQINTIYFQKLHDTFSGADTTNWKAVDALAEIKYIHRNCSILLAAASINQPSAGATTKPDPTKNTIAISGTITAGDVVSLSASGAAESLSQSVSYKVLPGESQTSVASGLINKIYHNLALTQAGVSAGLALSQPTAGSILFTVQGGPSDIAWSATPAPAGVGAAKPTETVTVTPPAKPSS